MLRFRVLGSFEILDGNRPLPTGGARERFLLVTLLLNAGRLTTTDALIEALWPTPPPTAKSQLHNLVCQLRHRIPADLIASQRGGYRVTLTPHSLDLLEFRPLAARGHRSLVAGNHLSALHDLSAALSLWRGPALDDLPYELVATIRNDLQEEHFTATEAKLTAQLALHRYHDVLHALPTLIAEHPYRESLHEKHLLALTRTGRRTDALTTYHHLHRRFVTELGIPPGPALRSLRTQILHGHA